MYQIKQADEFSLRRKTESSTAASGGVLLDEKALHDLNNHLVVLSGSLEILQDALAEGREKMLTSYAQHALARMSQIFQDARRI